MARKTRGQKNRPNNCRIFHWKILENIIVLTITCQRHKNFPIRPPWLLNRFLHRQFWQNRIDKMFVEIQETFLIFPDVYRPFHKGIEEFHSQGVW